MEKDGDGDEQAQQGLRQNRWFSSLLVTQIKSGLRSLRSLQEEVGSGLGNFAFIFLADKVMESMCEAPRVTNAAPDSFNCQSSRVLAREPLCFQHTSAKRMD